MEEIAVIAILWSAKREIASQTLLFFLYSFLQMDPRQPVDFIEITGRIPPPT
jgi:hypothetical protein